MSISRSTLYRNSIVFKSENVFWSNQYIQVIMTFTWPDSMKSYWNHCRFSNQNEHMNLLWYFLYIYIKTKCDNPMIPFSSFCLFFYILIDIVIHSRSHSNWIDEKILMFNGRNAKEVENKEEEEENLIRAYLNLLGSDRLDLIPSTNLILTESV